METDVLIRGPIGNSVEQIVPNETREQQRKAARLDLMERWIKLEADESKRITGKEFKWEKQPPEIASDLLATAKTTFEGNEQTLIPVCISEEAMQVKNALSESAREEWDEFVAMLPDRHRHLMETYRWYDKFPEAIEIWEKFKREHRHAASIAELLGMERRDQFGNCLDDDRRSVNVTTSDPAAGETDPRWIFSKRELMFTNNRLPNVTFTGLPDSYQSDQNTERGIRMDKLRKVVRRFFGRHPKSQVLA